MMRTGSASEARQLIYDRVHSGDWWTIVSTTEEGHELCRRLQRELFNDQLTDDVAGVFPFLTNVDGGVQVAVMFVRRSSMTITDVQSIAAGWGATSPEALSKPILFAGVVSAGVKEWFAYVIDA